MKRTRLKSYTPLRRYTPLRQRSRTNARQPACSSYLKWIRTLPCAVCQGVLGKSEAAHTHQLEGSGMGRKSPNKSAIPLCIWCHRLNPDSYHALTPESRWAEYHGLDLPQVLSDLHVQFALAHPVSHLRRAA